MLIMAETNKLWKDVINRQSVKDEIRIVKLFVISYHSWFFKELSVQSKYNRYIVEMLELYKFTKSSFSELKNW